MTDELTDKITTTNRPEQQNRHVQIFDVESETDVLCTDDKQLMSDSKLNAWAVELLAESFAKCRPQWAGKAVVLIGYGKDELPVYISVSSQAPKTLGKESEEAA